MPTPKIPNSNSVYSAQKIFDLEDEIAELNKKLLAQTTLVAQKDERIKELEALLEKSDKTEEIAKLKQEKKNLENEISRLNKALALASKYKEENEASQKEIDQLKAIIESMSSSAETYAAESQTQQEAIEILEHTVLEAEIKLAELEKEQVKEVKALNKKNKTLQTNLDKKKTELKEVLKELEELKNSLAEYEKQIKKLKVEVAASQGVAEVNKRLTRIAEGHSRAVDYRLVREEEKHTKATQQVKEKVQIIKDQEVEIAEQTTRADNAERKVVETEYKLDVKDKKLAGATSKIVEIKNNLSEVQTEKQEALKEMEEVVDELLKAEEVISQAEKTIIENENTMQDQAQQINEANVARNIAIADKNAAQAKANALQEDNVKLANEAENTDLFNATYKIILEEFNAQYPKAIDLDKAEKADKANGDLYRVVKTAKKKKYANKDKGYAKILEKIVARYDALLAKSSEQSKKTLASNKKIKAISITESKKVCEKVIDYYSSKFKSNVKVASWVAIGLVAVVSAGVVYGYLGQNKQIEDATDRLNDANVAIENVENELSIEQVNGIVKEVVGDFNAIVRDHGYASVVNNFYSGKQTRTAGANEVSDFDTIVNAQARANEMVVLDDSGKLNANCELGKAVDAYSTAVKAGNVEEANASSAKIVECQETMSALADNTNIALNSMLDNAGITMNDLVVLMDILNAPSISFTDEELSGIRDEFNVAGKRWNVDKVLSCKYDKKTGTISMLIESSYRNNKVLSTIKFNIQSELALIEVEDIHEGYKNAKNNNTLQTASYIALDTTINNSEVTLDGQTGNVQLGYKLNESNEAGLYKVGGDAIIVLTNDEGNLVTVKVVSADAKTVSEADLVNTRNNVVETLLNKINSVLGTSAELADEAIENE